MVPRNAIRMSKRRYIPRTWLKHCWNGINHTYTGTYPMRRSYEFISTLLRVFWRSQKVKDGSLFSIEQFFLYRCFVFVLLPDNRHMFSLFVSLPVRFSLKFNFANNLWFTKRTFLASRTFRKLHRPPFDFWGRSFWPLNATDIMVWFSLSSRWYM